jgi:hypothetical protein
MSLGFILAVLAATAAASLAADRLERRQSTL